MALTAKEDARKQANAEKIHSLLEDVVFPILRSACEQLNQRGIDGRLEGCGVWRNLSAGAQIVHRDHAGGITSIARLLYDGNPDTLAIRFAMYGSQKYASINSEEKLTLEDCTAEHVAKKTRAFLRAILGL